MTLKRGHDLPEHSRLDGDVPVVSSSGITGWHKEAKAKAPGVVTGRYGTIGEVFFLEQDYWPLNTALYVIDFKGNDPKFLAYFLRNTLRGYQSEKAAVPGVDRNVLHEIKVRAPDRTTQLRICDHLAAYDDLIENNRRRMALLEESARLLYQEWFIRLRFPGYEHTRILDGVPEGWDKGFVSDFYDTSSGGTPSRKVPEYFSGDIPWVKTQELSNGFITNTGESITEAALTKSSAKLFPVKTVLIALYGATVGELGILAIPAATNQACCAVLPRDARAHYIYAFLFFRENKEKLVGLSAGAAQRNISQQIVRGVEMIMPNKALIELFVNSLDPVFDQILTLQQSNQKLRAARDLLLPRLMSGEIAV
ncbi:MAG: restriction endonuclease subunit S [Rhizobium sp.]|nr:restriction endonuclease subunit S [Rhizobium sp.]